MAAVVEAHVPEVVDLSQLGKGELNALLDEEIACWSRTLDWDFETTASIIRRFVDVQALSGFALIVDSRVAGYVYYVAEDRKGLIGDLYLLAEHRSWENENLLLGSAIEALVRHHRAARVEAQMMLSHYPRRTPAPFARHLRTHQRNYMIHEMNNLNSLPARALGDTVRIDQWQERFQEDAAHAIAGAYRGHIDGDINDQYRSPAGARRFLLNIVQYPGCGIFFEPASWLAWIRESHMLCGLSLTSLVARDVGHITQICVLPGVQGTGTGYELMRRSLVSLSERGCRRTSLTVTAANHSAVRLYERMDYRTWRTFCAMVWDGLDHKEIDHA